MSRARMPSRGQGRAKPHEAKEISRRLILLLRLCSVGTEHYLSVLQLTPHIIINKLLHWLVGELVRYLVVTAAC